MANISSVTKVVPQLLINRAILQAHLAVTTWVHPWRLFSTFGKFTAIDNKSKHLQWSTGSFIQSSLLSTSKILPQKVAETVNFNKETLRNLLDHDNLETRNAFRAFVTENKALMTPRYNISVAEERQLALKRLQYICNAGFISVKDFLNNPLRIFATHEMSGIVDPSMTTKMTVQFNLFGK